jgi:hypothetical protein
MDLEPGPMQGDYRLYDEPPRIIYETRKVNVEPSALPELVIGMTFENSDEFCQIVGFDKNGQPWAECQRVE